MFGLSERHYNLRIDKCIDLRVCTYRFAGVSNKSPMKTNKPEPTISMRDFFQLPEVIAAQNVQKRNPYRSEAHRKAHDAIMAEAIKYGAQDFIGEY